MKACCRLLVALVAMHASCALAGPNVFMGERWFQQPSFDGFTFLRSEADGFTFQVGRNFDQGISLDIISPDGFSYANELEFVGDVGPLAVGHYGNVRGWPGNAPGMQYTISTGAVTNFVGEFDVLEVAYAPDGAVQRLAIDFLLSSPSIHVRQFDRGRLRINSSFLIPEPATAATILPVVALALAARRRNAGA